MAARGSIVKSISVLILGVLLACSGGGSTGSGLPIASGANVAQASDQVAGSQPIRTSAGLVVNPAATTVDSCTLTSPCISGTNTSTGAGMGGTSTSGRGVSGTTKHNSTGAANAMYGLYGQDASTSGSFNGGVFGTSVRGTGVTGTSSSNIGIRAISTSYYGLYSTSTNSIGAAGVSSSYIGVYGAGVAEGLYASATTGNGVFAFSSSGSAVDASSSTGYGIQAHTGGHVGVYVTNSNGNGGDIQGSYIGVVGRAPATGFPIVATDTSGNNLFYVDGAGNVSYKGTLNSFAVLRNGGEATAFSTAATKPSIEDTGTAHLVSGRATVALDSTFARAIDTSRPYQVFLTPGGDTRGLYVQRKTASSFIVREVQGGHGTFDFDYHIYARAIASGGRRMTIVRPNAQVPRASSSAQIRLPEAQEVMQQ